MYVLKPVSKERIWGTERLHDFGGDKAIDRIGSVYTFSAIPEISNTILGPENKGESLYDVINQNPEKFGLKQGENFPIIISFTGADSDLSIQVHPTDEYASSKENSLIGKSESWYFINEPTDGWIYAGSKKTDKNEIQKDMLDGKFEDVVDRESVKQEDLVFIPSGTLHALTKGALVYEIQQSTDITYRFYDYDRKDKNGEKRELHLEQAIETLQPHQNVSKTMFEADHSYNEKPYTIKKVTLSSEYKNETNQCIVLTNLEKETSINQLSWPKGYSVLLLPGEKFEVDESTVVMEAIPHIYWRG